MTGSPHYVLDCSMTLSWFFEDELTAKTSALWDALPDDLVVVPELWLFELSNALLVAERKKRTTEAKIDQFLDRLLKQPITIDRTAADRALSSTRSLAARTGLSAYDATYLDLSIRSGIPLATLDKSLAKAAMSVKVPLVLKI